jgi:hypothetical protein
MNRKNLTAAVLAGLAGAAGIVGSAQAVNINPDGLGQLLIYPYYTTNGGNVTLLSVVNTTGDAKAVKVRFLEGQNSREVLDFNMYMSAYDVWTAALYDDAGTPTMQTTDTTCTVPYLYETNGGVQEFLPWRLNDAEYLDKDYKGKQTKEYGDISRASEGHFEMIEMGTMYDTEIDNEDWVDVDNFPFCETGSPVVYGNPSGACLGLSRPWTAAELAEPETLVPNGSASAATHEDGVPADCGQLVDAWTRAADPKNDGYWIKDNMADMGPPSGGLFGGAAIVNVQGGAMYSYDAKAIDGFAGNQDGITKDDLHQEPGTILPSLDSGGNGTGIVFVNGEALESVDLNRGVDAVSYVFMHDQIMNEYTTETNINAGTEWIITFPTKQFYVHQAFLDEYEDFYRPDDDIGAPAAPVVPFTDDWRWVQTTYVKDEDDKNTPVVKKAGYVNRPCEAVTLDKVWDREEGEEETVTVPGTPRPPIVSPAPPPIETDPEGIVRFELCYETSVIAFGSDIGDTTAILGSSNFHRLDNTALGFDNGWARINFLDGSKDSDQDGELEVNIREPLGAFDTGLRGLPVTGFAVESFSNGFLGEGANVLSSYGGIFQHKATRKLASRGDYPQPD